MVNDNGKREDYIDLREGAAKEEPAFEEIAAPEALKARKKKRRWGAFGTFLIIAGLVLAASGWALGARGGSLWFDYNRGWFNFSTGEEAAKNDINITQRNMEIFTSAEISSSVADVEFIPSNDYGIEIRVPEGSKPEWSVENGILKVDITSNSKINLFGINFSTANYFVKVYYPKKILGNVEIDVSSGDVTFPEAEVGRIAIKVLSGDVNVYAKNYGIAQIKVESGDVYFEGFGEREKADISVSSGNISASVNGARDVILKVNSGEIEADVEGCETVTAKVSSGDIILNGIDKSNTSMELKTNLGNIEIDGDYVDDDYVLKHNGDYKLNATVSSGDITINY
jgi:DUF4097 and DUF4098 domain-containing protein YvlB